MPAGDHVWLKQPIQFKANVFVVIKLCQTFVTIGRMVCRWLYREQAADLSEL